MKRIINLSTTLLLGIVFTSFFNMVNAQETTTKKNNTEQQFAKKYTCPMHPEVVTDKPAKCPKCGMALVEKKGTKKDGMHDMHDNSKMHDSTMMKKDSTKTKM
jgi:hypothetical protein